VDSRVDGSRGASRGNTRRKRRRWNGASAFGRFGRARPSRILREYSLVGFAPFPRSRTKQRTEPLHPHRLSNQTHPKRITRTRVCRTGGAQGRMRQKKSNQETEKTMPKFIEFAGKQALCSLQPTNSIFFTPNQYQPPATSQPAIFFSNNKSAPTTIQSQPNKIKISKAMAS